jgi:hypothetical protein
MERRFRAALSLILLLLGGLTFLSWSGRIAQRSQESQPQNSSNAAAATASTGTAPFSTVSPSKPFFPGAAAVAIVPNVKAIAAAPSIDSTPLSDSVRRQIVALQKEKASRTAAERKIDSQLLQARKLDRGEPIADGVRLKPPDLDQDERGRVLVDMRAEVTDPLLRQIGGSGGEVVNNFPRFQAIRAFVTLDQLATLAELPDVKSIRPAARVRVNTGSVTSEGDATHGADLTRAALGPTGAGVRVGVLSDSVTHLEDSIGTGDLPTNVMILSGQSGTNYSGVFGEGTAMLEIVHDLAPDAELWFATAFNGPANFAQNILDLRSNGCNIIVDDAFYYDEPPFQDGIIAQAVNSVTADGALYFSSAGNDGNQNSGTSGTWEGDFLDGGPVVPPVDAYEFGTGTLHDFGGQTFTRVLGSPSTFYPVFLFWSDPMGAATNDYDLFVLDPGGANVATASNNFQDGTQDPYEQCNSFANHRVVVVKYSGDPRFLHVQLVTKGTGRLSLATVGNVRGHWGSTNAICVGAVNANSVYPGSFTNSNIIETYSSDGPRHVFFHADGTPITPGNFSSTGGFVRQKPDLAAADRVSTTVPGFQPFNGSSAAAPHAAALAALLLSFNSAVTPTAVYTALTNTAIDIETPGLDVDSGAGIAMLQPAIASIYSLLRPSLHAIAQTNNTFVFSWNAMTGHTYQVQYKLNLTNGAWTDAGSPLSATNSPMILTDATGSDARRFYRVLLLP